MCFSMKKKYKYPNLLVSVKEEEKDIIRVLKDKHCVNISAFVRQKLHELYNSLESLDPKSK